LPESSVCIVILRKDHKFFHNLSFVYLGHQRQVCTDYGDCQLQNLASSTGTRLGTESINPHKLAVILHNSGPVNWLDRPF
jgi:hypothetical protein